MWGGTQWGERGHQVPWGHPYGCWELNSSECINKPFLQPVYSFTGVNSTQTCLFTSALWLEMWRSVVLGWQARSPALHKLGTTAHTCEDSTEGYRKVSNSTLSLATEALSLGSLYTPSWEGTAGVHFTLTEVTALMAWHPCLYLFTHDLPSHLTCTFLCAMLRLKPRPHTCYTGWTSILPLQHLFLFSQDFS